MRGRPMLRGAAALAPREPAPTPNVPSNSNQIAGKKIASAPAPPTTLPVRDSGSAGPIPSTSKRPSSPEQDTTTPLAKRQKQQGSPASENSPDETSHLSLQGGGAGGGWQEGESDNVTALQRLGFWQCRLCETRKYLEAGAGRTPAAPCKWPLKDVSKMITHFTDMHLEHSAAERCVELGTALNRNRGPFEYWLRRTRQQNIGDGSCMDEAIGMLVEGQMPPLLRKLSRAAARMAEY
ncbi:hypothetical protein QBC47DRAFT_387577 [Echria macrotheca]|uniref:Uncharacterized protein n=1 Tax=Echria macrotheca TaxID=438768 RepID=A0AAJ0F9C9_9PEZI|nr:hypothetical protein QBC47DRAFT_387577 [Echria macrotheca]